MNLVQYFKCCIFGVMEHKIWDQISLAKWTFNILNFHNAIF
jgi:hypothetical protein